MLRRFPLLLAVVATLLVVPAAARASNSCLDCHPAMRQGFNAAHAFGESGCAVCHAGDPEAETAAAAHLGMEAFPGNLANAEAACGGCHADRVAGVRDSLMHTGHGMVDVTRRLVEGRTGNDEDATLQTLGHGVADSMLRKLCASCHLGQEKTAHALDAMSDRGGGCLACHINRYPANAHPALTTDISDARCFGCHARSGRISLNYVGLAEVLDTPVDEKPLRLGDGRLVARQPADVHYRAGMACVDCHTADGLMGGVSGARHQRDAVLAACTDCHPAEELSHAADTRHARLECSACHSQWAPQCFGCHMSYEPGGEQWDHVDKRVTAGRWHEQRSNIRNGLGTLGVNRENRIEIFVPGMIMTIDHPAFEAERFVRVFAPLSPHTTGASRSCASCHRSPEALGLGQGRLRHEAGRLIFEATQPLLQDGLPADAWTNIDGTLGGKTPLSGQRPLNGDEIRAVLEAPLD